MRIATICVVAAALFAAVAAGAGDTAAPRGCVSFKVRAQVDGKAVCLKEGEQCRPGHKTDYARSGLRCRGGRIEFDWSRLRRPVRIPELPLGSPCPASTARTVNASNPRFGPGPAYPTLGNDAGRASMPLTWRPAEPPYLGWSGTKVLWSIPSYAGAVLIRGRQLDGPSPVGFDLGPQWSWRVHSEIRLVGPEAGNRPAATFVRTPGCYAYQVDTVRSSYLIVFRAQPES